MSREMGGGGPTPTAAEVIAEAALAEIINEVVFGESNAEAHQRIGAAVLDALAAAGWLIDSRDAAGEREMHHSEAMEWIVALEEFIRDNELRVPTWADVAAARTARAVSSLPTTTKEQAMSKSALEVLARSLMGSGRAITWTDNEDGTGVLYVPDDLPDPIEIRRIPRPVPFSTNQEPIDEQ